MMRREDGLGRELKIGQRVVYIWTHGNMIFKDLGYIMGVKDGDVRFARRNQGSGRPVPSYNCYILSEEGL